MNPFLAATISIGLDYGSTRYALSQGAIERNQFIRSHLEIKKSAEIVLIGAGIKLIEKRNKKAGKITKIVLMGSHVLIAGINIRNGIRSKR